MHTQITTQMCMENSLQIWYHSYCNYECNRNVHYTLTQQIPPSWDWTIIRRQWRHHHHHHHHHQQQQQQQQWNITQTRRHNLFTRPRYSRKWKGVNWWLVHYALKLTLSALWNSYIKCREIKCNKHKGSYKQ